MANLGRARFQRAKLCGIDPALVATISLFARLGLFRAKAGALETRPYLRRSVQIAVIRFYSQFRTQLWQSSKRSTGFLAFSRPC
jgi:hypothetical protein